MIPYWYIDALDPAAGRAFITKRLEEATLAESNSRPVFVSPPHFVAEPIANPATALAAARVGFQLGVFTRNDAQLRFLSLEEAIEFVRRIYARVGGTGRDGGGERRLEPGPDRGGDPGALNVRRPDPRQFDAVLRAIDEFGRMAQLPDEQRKEPRPVWPWGAVINYIPFADWDDLLDWGLHLLWRFIQAMRSGLPSDEALVLAQRYNDGVLAVGGRFTKHLQWANPHLHPAAKAVRTMVDHFDLLAALPSPPAVVTLGPNPDSLAELLALSVASPIFVGSSLETLALVLVAASIVAHEPVASVEGYIGRLGPRTASAGVSGARWLADNWPRSVQSSEAEELIRDVSLGGSAAFAGP